MEAEITVWSVNAYTPPAPVRAAKAVKPGAAPASDGHRALFDAALGRETDALVYGRAGFKPGGTVAGPAVITEDETTVVLPSSRVASVLADGSIDIAVKGA